MKLIPANTPFFQSELGYYNFYYPNSEVATASPCGINVNPVPNQIRHPQSVNGLTPHYVSDNATVRALNLKYRIIWT